MELGGTSLVLLLILTAEIQKWCLFPWNQDPVAQDNPQILMRAVWCRNCFISLCLLFVRHPASQRPRPRSIQARLWGQAEELLSKAGDQGLRAGSRKSQVSSGKMLCQGCRVWYWFKSAVEAQEVRIRWEICIYWGLKLRNSWKQEIVLWWWPGLT